MDSQGFKNAKKREKTVSRAYGGSRCHACVRQRSVCIPVTTLQCYDLNDSAISLFSLRKGGDHQTDVYICNHYCILQSRQSIFDRRTEDCEKSFGREVQKGQEI